MPDINNLIIICKKKVRKKEKGKQRKKQASKHDKIVQNIKIFMAKH
jgi:hypothetical protein